MRCKSIGWMTAALLLGLLIAGCKKEDATTPGPAGDSGGEESITIWWAQWDPAVGLQELGNEFQKETGIAVKVNQIPWTDYQQQVFRNFAKDKTDFDIVIGDSQWIGRGATDKLYVELTDWLPSAVNMSEVHPRAARYLCEYPTGSGKYFAAPCETDAIGFVYRKDWFEDSAEKSAFQTKYKRELAPPKTWSEFRDIAEFFHRPQQQRYGAALLTGRSYDSLVMGYQQFMWAWGGDWGDRDTYSVQGILNSQGSVESLQFLKDLLKFGPPDGANLDYARTPEFFINGSTAMAMNYFAFFPGIAKQMGDKAGFFVIPEHNGKRAVSLGGQGFSISAKTSKEKQELAKQFIGWFQKREVQEKWVTKPAGFTANAQILASESFKSASPYNAAFAESLNHVQDFWNVPEYNDLLEVAQRNLGEALDGVQTPQAALDKIATEHERILKAAGHRK